MRLINEIIVHTSDTPKGWMQGKSVDAKRDEIKRWHINRKPPFRTIGYHMVIDRSGDMARGRPDKETGAHVSGHNKTTLGVCLIGGGGPKDQKFSDNFTPAQDKRLRLEIANWRKRYPTITKVSGHHDYDSGKTCPCFDVSEWYSKKPAPKKSWWQVFLSLFTSNKPHQ